MRNICTITVHAYIFTYTVYYVGKHAPRMFYSCKSRTSWLLLHTRYTCTCIWFRLRVALVAFTLYIGYVDTLSFFFVLTHYVCCVYALCLLRLHRIDAESKRITFTFPLTCTVRSTKDSKIKLFHTAQAPYRNCYRLELYRYQYWQGLTIIGRYPITDPIIGASLDCTMVAIPRFHTALCTQLAS